MLTIKSINGSIITREVSWSEASSIIDSLEINGSTGNVYYFDIEERTTRCCKDMVRYVFRYNNWMPCV